MAPYRSLMAGKRPGHGGRESISIQERANSQVKKPGIDEVKKDISSHAIEKGSGDSAPGQTCRGVAAKAKKVLVGFFTSEVNEYKCLKSLLGFPFGVMLGLGKTRDEWLGRHFIWGLILNLLALNSFHNC